MSIRNKIALILAMVAVLYVTIDVILMRTIVAKPFSELEQEEAAKDIKSVKATLDGVVHDLQLRARTLARLPQTASLLKGGGNGDFETDALGADALETRDLNLLYICNPDGNVIWGRIEQSSDRSEIRVREFPRGSLGNQHPVFLDRGDEASNSGLITTEHGPILVGSDLVLSKSGEVVGSVVVGHFFDDALKANLLDRLNIEIDIWPLEGALPARARALRNQVTSSPTPVMDPEGADNLVAYSTLNSIQGFPELMIRAKFDRAITKSGDRTFYYALASTLVMTILILVAVLRLLNMIVIRPLGELTSHAVEIGRTENVCTPVAMVRNDEIGTLSKEFDSLMGKLADSRSQVVNSARIAGMSEIASGVLHSVGNVLNSVNVSTTLVRRRTEHLAIRVQDLEATLEILDKYEDGLGDFLEHDSRGQQFLPFLSELTRAIGSLHAEITEELRRLGGSVVQTLSLVRSQQSYAGKTGSFEPADLGAEIDAAAAICDQAIGFKGDVRYVREFEELPMVSVDKHRLMEILVNLIQNAQQVMEEHGVDPKVLTLRVLRDGDEHALIEVQDNGPGIGEQDLTRVFEHGYTTQKDRHGVGLHLSMIAASEMEASLWAESEGLGKGATFIMRIRRVHGAVAEAA